MSVCAESRKIAVEAHSLFDLRPSIRVDPFYFSGENTICLLRDEKPFDLENFRLWPPIENGDSHPWNVFRNKVTTVAIEPLLYNGQLKMREDPMEEAIFASIQADKLAAAIATFPNLKQVIVLRRKKHEKRVHLILKGLDYCMSLGSDGYHPVILSSAYGMIPPVRLLDYKYRNGEDALVAMRKVLMGYAEKALKPAEEWINRGREILPYEDDQ